MESRDGHMSFLALMESHNSHKLSELDNFQLESHNSRKLSELDNFQSESHNSCASELTESHDLRKATTATRAFRNITTFFYGT